MTNEMAPQNEDNDERENSKRAGHGAPQKREKKPPKKITEKYLYNSGLAYLQRFPTSTPHFRRVMGRKIDRSCHYHKDQSREECATLLEKTTQNFIRIGLLNDEAYLAGMINSLRRRGLSAQGVMSKLTAKGMAQSTILPALKNYDAENGNENPELIAALLLIRRKRLGCFGKNKDGVTNKELSALARAGFSYELSQKVLMMTMEDVEALQR